jgi:prepilin-type N-terminal cleavage/methylation domain-containing protein
MKIKAFTLIELLICMILSAIIIGMGYAAYRESYKRFLAYSGMKKNIVDAIRVNSVLNNDFCQAERVYYNSGNILFNNKNKPAIEYEFTSATIIRKVYNQADTFHFSAINTLPVYVDNDAIATEGLIKAFSFETEMYKQTLPFYYSKTYSAETIINLSQQQ